jgi:hypothetical protein
MDITWPVMISDEAVLKEVRSHPVTALAKELANAPGDMLVVGAAAEMGPTLCRLAKRAEPARRAITVAGWHGSRIVFFSTGSVPPLVAVGSGADDEATIPTSISEYAASCLGRECGFPHDIPAGNPAVRGALQSAASVFRRP